MMMSIVAYASSVFGPPRLKFSTVDNVFSFLKSSSIFDAGFSEERRKSMTFVFESFFQSFFPSKHEEQKKDYHVRTSTEFYSSVRSIQLVHILKYYVKQVLSHVFTDLTHNPI